MTSWHPSHKEWGEAYRTLKCPSPASTAEFLSTSDPFGPLGLLRIFLHEVTAASLIPARGTMAYLCEDSFSFKGTSFGIKIQADAFKRPVCICLLVNSRITTIDLNTLSAINEPRYPRIRLVFDYLSPNYDLTI